MKNILFINHKEKQCGVYQYGYRIAMILQKSTAYNFIYCEVEHEIEFDDLIWEHSPIAVFYNYHIATMGWVNDFILEEYPDIKHYGIYHEGNDAMKISFDYYLNTDSTTLDVRNKFSLPRPLFEDFQMEYVKNSVPIIGSFGFGFNNKGFERLCSMVNEQFDEAVIRLHIPFSHYGDSEGHSARGIVSKCVELLTKPTINLVATHDFLSDHEVLDFLAQNTLNAFLYDEMPNRGLSSVIDYALSVNVPIAITNTDMFRHIKNTYPSIVIENTSLKDIIEAGTIPLKQYKNMWSNDNLIKKCEHILDKTLHK